MFRFSMIALLSLSAPNILADGREKTTRDDYKTAFEAAVIDISYRAVDGDEEAREESFNYFKKAVFALRKQDNLCCETLPVVYNKCRTDTQKLNDALKMFHDTIWNCSAVVGDRYMLEFPSDTTADLHYIRKYAKKVYERRDELLLSEKIDRWAWQSLHTYQYNGRYWITMNNHNPMLLRQGPPKQ